MSSQIDCERLKTVDVGEEQPAAWDAAGLQVLARVVVGNRMTVDWKARDALNMEKVVVRN